MSLPELTGVKCSEELLGTGWTGSTWSFIHAADRFFAQSESNVPPDLLLTCRCPQAGRFSLCLSLTFPLALLSTTVILLKAIIILF